ncbi:MAG TPA: efflux RND transporter periplasmic adaptor subunit [Terriglobales bacterium]|nr:efflux RND transporter periplasmic adaptor subunit [Terriglobales bacterium]
MSRLRALWRKSPALVVALVVLVAGGAAFGARRLLRSVPEVPIYEVRRGEFVDYLQVRGEVKAQKSIVLTAPMRAGDIQIVHLAPSGTQLHKGEVVVEFDTADLKSKLEQRRSDLKQAEAEIENTRATGHITEQQDLTDLQKAKYDVERAKLDASKQEILSQIEGEESKIKLADAQQKEHELEEKLKADRAGMAADIGSKQLKRNKALFDVQQAESAISQMKLVTPVDGMVAMLPNFRNWRPGGAPDFKEGDRAWPGAGIAQVPDLSTIHVNARVDETDRGRIKTGQRVLIRVDAVPGREFAGKIAAISPLTKQDFSGWPPVKNFDLTLDFDGTDPRLRPGMSATVRIAVDHIADTIIVPADAAFMKNGRTVVYALRGGAFEEVAVDVDRRGSGEVAISRGLDAGEKIALKDPTLVQKQVSR